MTPRVVTPFDDEYPSRLGALPKSPKSLSLAGPPLSAPVVIAVVGTRHPVAEAERFAYEFAAGVCRAGATVVSGGARGIDAAAHRGAMNAGGRTWVVAATGCEHTYPAEHGALYDDVVRCGGTMVWPFASDAVARPQNFFGRNAVLVALADHVVVVQAGFRSGAMNAAKWARRLGRPLWAIAGPPWIASGFEGCWLEIERGARPLPRVETFVRKIGLHPGAQPRVIEREAPPDPDEYAVIRALTVRPKHADEICADAGLAFGTASRWLTLLCLRGVAVEAEAGFYRRA